MATRNYSDKQEIRIANLLYGKVQSNSGGTKFGGGDVHTSLFLIEAKTNETERKSFTIKKEWLDKMKEQQFEQGKMFSSLAISFDNEKDYFLVDANTFSILLHLIEGEEEIKGE